jgi:uncharacterized membrane protein YgdD (TMEM256/DUF423 family)
MPSRRRDRIANLDERNRHGMGKWLAAAGLNGLMGVGFGAWAAHGAASQVGLQATEWLRTGSQYQLWHAVALLGLAAGPIGQRGIGEWVGSCFCSGALLFSVSLYALALLQWHWLVFITPLGGTLMLLGWAILMLFGIKTWWKQL